MLEQAIVGEMLSMQDNPKERAISEHRVKNFVEMARERAKHVVNFMKEEEGLKR